jgi:hypothetical protein
VNRVQSDEEQHGYGWEKIKLSRRNSIWAAARLTLINLFWWRGYATGRRAGREGKGRRGVEEPREVEATAGRAGSGNPSGERRSVARRAM